MKLGSRLGAILGQIVGFKLIPLDAEPANDSTCDQVFDLPTTNDNVSTGPLLKDKSGIKHPLVVGADGCGVVQIEFGDSPFQVLAHHRKVLVDTSGGAVTCLLPAGTAIQRGTSIEFVDQARSFGTNALTIDGGAADINDAGTLVRSTNDGSATVTWGGVTWSYAAGASSSSASVAALTVTGTLSMEDGSLLQRKGRGTGTGDVIERIGATATEGLELKVIDVTVTPAAVETAVATLPAGSIPIAVLGNVQAALTGGGTTVTWSLGTAGDPDKYGTAGLPTAAADSLAKNSKSSWLGPFTQLTAAEPIVLTGAATGGASDGNTALSVGSVRVVIIYWTVNALDDAP